MGTLSLGIWQSRRNRTALLVAAFVGVIFGNILLTHQAMAGGPIMAGKSFVQGTDRINGITYGDPSGRPTNNPSARTLRVFKGDTVSFSFLLENWDPFPIGGFVTSEFRSINFVGQDSLVAQGERKNYIGLIRGLPSKYWHINKSTVVLDGPGSDIPGSRFCEYVQTDPTVYDFLNPVNALTGGVTLGLHKFNNHDDSIVFPLSVLQGVRFPLGDVMSCAEIAFNYNLMPRITLGTPTGGSAIPATPAVTQGSLVSGSPTYSQDTQWQVSRFLLPSNATPPDVAISGSNPCGYFNATYRVRDCTIAVQSAGTNTVFNADGGTLRGSYFPSSLPIMDATAIPSGYVVCYALSVNAYAPYLTSSPWRHSKVVCTDNNVIKKPKLQVRGGDIRVGRYFSNQAADGAGASAGIYTSTTSLPVSGVGANTAAVFGSWVEYGALAPGPIISFASLSGYAGGFLIDSSASLNGCPIALNKLTFANPPSAQCGRFKQDMGQIPDIVTSLTSRRAVNVAIGGTIRFDENSTPGVYKNETSTTTLSIDSSVIGPGTNHTYVVYMPKATVKLTGDIALKDYATQRYSDIKRVPQLIIIAKNIDIESGVKRVDAWLIAQGTGTDGVVTTCTGFTPPLSARLCSDQLYLNGPIMARQLKPWRTASYEGTCSVTSAADITRASGCVAESPSNTNTVGKPAEIINLPGTSLLWSLSQGGSSRAQTTYTAELPPFF